MIWLARLLNFWRLYRDCGFDGVDATGWEPEDEQKLRLFLRSSTGKRFVRRASAIAMAGMEQAANYGSAHLSGVALGRKGMVVWIKSLSAIPGRDMGEQIDSPALPGADAGAESTVPE